MAELIQKQDTLNEGRVKINAAITDAEQAKVTADGADSKATQALANSESTQTQLDTIVINGDSSVEAAQARVDEKGVGHTTLKDRIDDGFTKVTSQLNQTNSQLAQNVDNVSNYGLTGDGTDETTTAESVMNEPSNDNLLFPYTEEGYVINEIVIPYQKLLNGRLTKVRTDQPDKKIFEFSNGSEYIYDISVGQFEFSQPLSSDPGTGNANNHSPLSFVGTINGKALFNNFKSSALGIRFSGLGKYNLAAFNYFENLEKMAIENFSTSYNRLVGNAVDGQGGNSNGFRFTGYNGVNGGLERQSFGNVAIGNIISGMRNAYSFQNTAKYNSTSASHSKDISHALVEVSKGTSVDNVAEFNIVNGATFKNAYRAIENNEGQFSDYHIVGSDIEDIGIFEPLSSAEFGDKGHNHYKGIIKNVGGRGLDLRRPNNRLDIDLINVDGNGAFINVGANNTNGSLSIDGAGTGVQLYSDFNNLQLTVRNCTNYAIVVGGNNNTLFVNTDGDIQISGDNNIIYGHVGGSINSSGDNNDFSNVVGYSLRKRVLDVQTDENGRVSVPHNLKTTKVIGFVNVITEDNLYSRVRFIGDTNASCVFYNADGTLYANQTVSFHLMLEAY